MPNITKRDVEFVYGFRDQLRENAKNDRKAAKQMTDGGHPDIATHYSSKATSLENQALGLDMALRLLKLEP